MCLFILSIRYSENNDGNLVTPFHLLNAFTFFIEQQNTHIQMSNYLKFIDIKINSIQHFCMCVSITLFSYDLDKDDLFQLRHCLSIAAKRPKKTNHDPKHISFFLFFLIFIRPSCKLIYSIKRHNESPQLFGRIEFAI